MWGVDNSVKLDDIQNVEQSKLESLHFIQSWLYKTCTVSVYINPTTVSARIHVHILYMYVGLPQPDQP